MAILARIIQFFLWLILATWLGRKLLGWLFGPKQEIRTAGPRGGARPLHRDPVCGTYVSPEISFSLEREGVVHHFCSTGCRAQFEREQPPARSSRAGVGA